MMCEQYPMDPKLADFLEVSNLIITALFTLEMVLKLVVLGCVGYWGDAYNRFDGIIVFASLADVASAFVDVAINAQAPAPPLPLPLHPSNPHPRCVPIPVPTHFPPPLVPSTRPAGRLHAGPPRLPFASYFQAPPLPEVTSASPHSAHQRSW